MYEQEAISMQARCPSSARSIAPGSHRTYVRCGSSPGVTRLCWAAMSHRKLCR